MSLGYTGKRERAPCPRNSRGMGFTDDTFAPLPGIRILTKVYDDSEQDYVEPVTETNSWNDKIWKGFVIVGSISSCIAFIVYSAFIYHSRNPIILPLLIVVSIGIAIISWFQAMLSMNLLRCRVKPMRAASVFFYMAGAVAYASTAFAMMSNRVVAQFVTSMFGSMFGWIAFVTIFHGDFVLPTRQQFGSLVQILILTLLWETRAALINLHFTEFAQSALVD